MAPFLSLFFLFFITFSATLTTPANSLPAFFPRAAYQSLIKQVKTPKPKIPFKTHYFPQTLDHFTFQPKSSKIFYQKYLINSHYWHKGAPIFVYTGNEGNIEWFAANTGFMLDIAPKFKSLLVFIEVMFAKSLPRDSVIWVKKEKVIWDLGVTDSTKNTFLVFFKTQCVL